MSRLPAPRFFQLGYATRDLDRAVDLFGERYGVTEFLRVDTSQGSTPGPGLALAWRGDVMIEIFQPLASSEAVYASALDRGVVALHHLGHLVDSEEILDLIAADYEARGIAVPLRFAHRLGLSAINADTCAEVGHFSEFVVVHDEGRALFDSLPRNPVA